LTFYAFVVVATSRFAASRWASFARFRWTILALSESLDPPHCFLSATNHYLKKNRKKMGK